MCFFKEFRCINTHIIIIIIATRGEVKERRKKQNNRQGTPAHFDVTLTLLHLQRLNFDLTKMYLELVAMYVRVHHGTPAHFDVTLTLFQRLNFDLTKMYLELVATYVSIMILVSKVDDRKSVTALFNVAHEFLHGKG